MRKTLYTIGIAIIAAASVAACNQKEIDGKQATIDSLQVIVNNKDAEIDDLFQMLNEIESNLSIINSKYSAVQEIRRNGIEGNTTQKQEIQQQISSIEDIIATNKKKIAELNTRLNASNKKQEELQAFIANLEERSAAQEAQISQLMAELENSKMVIRNLNQNVSDLTASNREKDEYIAQQMHQANRAWFIVGSYDELKEAGIVNKTGGFIGIGRKLGTMSDMNTELFTQIDRTSVTTISIGKRKAKVVSQHPADSYELVSADDNPTVTAYLRILNPTQFWKYTDYLVISTK